MNSPNYQPRLRRLILVGTPLLTGILLLFHPRPDASAVGHAGLPEGMDLYRLLAPVADSFLAVHVLFAASLALLGLAVILLLDGVPGIVAGFSRASAFVFAVTYTLYETMIGTVSALLVRGAASLSPADQAAIGDAIYRNFMDPVFGDLPSVLSVTAWLSWLAAVVLAAIALRRAGKPPLPCILLGLSFIFISHASPLGSAGMLLFLLAVVGMERAGSPVASAVPGAQSRRGTAVN